MNRISSDFTEAELSKIISMVYAKSSVGTSVKELDEYITIILQEKNKPTENQIRNSTNDEFTSILEKLKDQRK